MRHYVHMTYDQNRTCHKSTYVFSRFNILQRSIQYITLFTTTNFYSKSRNKISNVFVKMHTQKLFNRQKESGAAETVLMVQFHSRKTIKILWAFFLRGGGY